MVLPSTLRETPAIALLTPILTRLSITAVMLAGLFVLSPTAQAYRINNRWGTTATDNLGTGPRGNPITLTWGFVADGTTITGPEGTSGSTLVSFMDTIFGAGPGGTDLTERPWFSIFADSFTRISELSGVTYVYEPNNTSDSIDSTTTPTGQLGVRPDIRIGAHPVDGSSGANSLAYSYFPNHSDLVLDTDNGSFFANSFNNYRPFRNILMHESGHGLGISHVVSSTGRFLMEPILNTTFDGPQLDDILALQRNYGDTLEKSAGNDTFATATLLGSLLDGSMLSMGTLGDTLAVSPSQVDFISIDGTSDTDFFNFTLTRSLDVTLNLTPRGATYNEGPEGGSQASFNSKALSDLTLALLDSDGTSILDLTNINGSGMVETISHLLAPGTYYARITGADDNVQLYGLDISGIRVAANLVWSGQQSSAWDVTVTENFVDEVGPVTFYNQDHVTFDDTAATFTVNLDEDVQPASVTVNTAGVYSFTGSGGIVAGMLTLTGGGTLELANDGNIYDGPTNVQEGTLIVVNSTGIGDTTVDSGAIVGGGGTVSGNLIALEGSIVFAGGTLAPSITGFEQDSTLTIDGNFTQVAGATLQLQLRSTLDFDALVVTEFALLDGVLSVSLADSFTATLGDQYDILTASGELEGMFSLTALQVPGPFLALEVLYDYDLDTVSLAVVPALPGDFNVDGIVNGRDFLAWQRGESPNLLSADDLADWQANYGIVLAEVSAQVTVVPEPRCLWVGLILVGFARIVGRSER